jgi:uncharacterized protein (DUF342 family)
VAGAVEAATIHARGSIHIRGGIFGKDKGKCITEESFVGRFLSHACVVAARDVTVHGEIVDSRIVCGGKLTATGGPIVGGKVSANSGIVCSAIGNQRGIPTFVEAGTSQILSLISAMAKIEIDANSQRSDDIRKKIGPLLKHLKGLTPQQREFATEMQYEADELDADSKAKSTQLEDRIRLIRETASDEIVVSGMVFPGARLRLTRHETLIRSELKGPLRILTRKTGAASEVVLIQGSSGVERILESRRLEEPTEASQNVSNDAKTAA